MVATAEITGTTETAERVAGPRVERTKYELIDCDVHQSIKDYTALREFMPVAWRRYVSARGFGGPSSGYQTSVGLYRKDVKPPDGGEPGTDPNWLRKQLMEQYNVKYAILNGGGILGLAALPDADF